MSSYKKLVEDLQWETGKGFAYYNQAGFLVTLINSVNLISYPPLVKRLVITFDEMNEEQRDQLQNHLSEDKKEFKLLGVEVKFSYVSIELDENKKTIEAQILQDLVDHIIGILISLGVDREKKCVYCKQELPDIITKIYGVQFHAHKECHESAKYDFDTLNVEYKDREKNYLQGTLGALFGAFLAMIPYTILSIYLNKISAVLAALICFSALFFYKNFGGKLTRITPFIIGVVTFLGIAFTSISVAIFIIYVNDGKIVLDNLIIIYTDPELSTVMIADLALGLMVGLFSIVSINGRIKNQRLHSYIK